MTFQFYDIYIIIRKNSIYLTPLSPIYEATAEIGILLGDERFTAFALTHPHYSVTLYTYVRRWNQNNRQSPPILIVSMLYLHADVWLTMRLHQYQNTPVVVLATIKKQKENLRRIDVNWFCHPSVLSSHRRIIAAVRIWANSHLYDIQINRWKARSMVTCLFYCLLHPEVPSRPSCVRKYA